jgi:ElaB/YqjD/DUF883 family membrane-anchored ribosome-binding protein
MTGTEATVDKLVADLQALVADAESLLQSGAGEAAGPTRTRVREILGEAREQIERIESKVVFEAKVAALEADRFVHERPWQAVGIAAAIGLVLGVLVSRK